MHEPSRSRISQFTLSRHSAIILFIIIRRRDDANFIRLFVVDSISNFVRGFEVIAVRWNDKRIPSTDNKLLFWILQLNWIQTLSLTHSLPPSVSLPFSRLDLHRRDSIDSIPNANWFDYLRMLCSRDRTRVYNRTRAPSTTCGYIEHKFDDYNSNLDIGRSLCVYVLHSKQICVRHVRCVCAKANTHDRASYSTIPGTYMFTTTQRTLRPTYEESTKEETDEREWFASEQRERISFRI